MKKIMCILLTMLLMIQTGCAGTTTSNTQNETFPTSLEQMLTASGGESESNSLYPISALRGEWVLDGVTDAWTASATDRSMTIAGEEIECLPTEISFSDSCGVDILESNDIGYGSATFQTAAADASFPASESFVFTTNDDTLALGLFEEYVSVSDGVVTTYGDSDAEKVQIEEVDYKIDWTGWKLTLTCNEVSATYVPEYMNQKDTYYTAGFNAAALMDGYSPVNGITAITCDEDGTGSVVLSDGQKYNAEFSFGQDGTVSIQVENGEKYNCNFQASGSTLSTTIVLEDGTDRAVYSTYAEQPSENTNIQVSGIQTDMPDSAQMINSSHIATLFSNVVAYEEDSINILGYTLQSVENKGFTIDYDLDQLLLPGEITDQITMTYKTGDVFTVKLVNPYENATPVGKLDICWYQYESVNSQLETEYGFEFGVTTYDEIFEKLREPYEQSSDELHYKGNYSHIIISDFEWNYGETLIQTNHDSEIYLKFTNGVLSGVVEEDQALLYCGIQDNVSEDELDVLTPSVYEEIAVRRDSILDELKAAFDEAGVDASINESTGEVTIDATVLFAHNDSELTEDSKQYLDDLTTVYLNTLLSEQFADEVSEIAIQGHTDTTFVDEYDNMYEYDLQLSQTRAENVMNYCFENDRLTEQQRDLFMQKATATGYAYTDPVYDSEGNVDDDASRRVCFKFYLTVD